MLQNKKFKSLSYTAFIIAAVTVALTFPQYFITAGEFQLKKLIVPLLQVITFGIGSTMSWRDLAGVVKMPKAVMVGLLCHYTIMPVVGYTIASAFNFQPEIAAGIVLVGCSPSGLASNVIAFIAKANLPLSVTITAFSTMLAPIMTPFLMKLLGRQFVPINFWGMLSDIIMLVIIPIAAGVLFNRLFRGRQKMIEKIMPKISMAGIAFIIIVTMAAGRNYFLTVGGLLILSMFLHMTAGLLLGYWGARLFRLPENDCRTVAIEVGMQNGGLASGIAAQMGKIATVGLAPAVNGPVMNTTFSVIGTWWGNRPVKKNSPDTQTLKHV
jgi:BASS family bile acid:Na+ symporter